MNSKPLPTGPLPTGKQAEVGRTKRTVTEERLGLAFFRNEVQYSLNQLLWSPHMLMPREGEKRKLACCRQR